MLNLEHVKRRIFFAHIQYSSLPDVALSFFFDALISVCEDSDVFFVDLKLLHLLS